MVLGVIVVVYWTARITNMDCLEESNSSRSLYASIRERERKLFFGQLMRREAF